MNELIKNLGVIVLIIGAAVLAVPFFTGGMTNTYRSGIGSPWLFWSYRNQQTSRIIHAT